MNERGGSCELAVELGCIQAKASRPWAVGNWRAPGARVSFYATGTSNVEKPL